MAESVRKFRFIDDWRVCELESWLIDMAAIGLHFEYFTYRCAYFKRGEPEKVRYRVEFTYDKDEQSDELREKYAGCGWEYVNQCKRLRIFRTAETPDAQKFPVNSTEHAKTLTKIKRNSIAAGIANVLSLILYAAVMILIFTYGRTSLLQLVDGRTLFNFHIILVFVSLFVRVPAEMVSRYKLFKRMREGRESGGRVEWKSYYRRSGTFVITYYILWLAVFALILSPLFTIRAEPLQSDNPMHLRITDIEGGSELYQSQQTAAGSMPEANRAVYRWTPFAPVIMSLNEHGSTHGSGGSSFIFLDLYKLTFPGMAGKLTENLCNAYFSGVTLYDLTGREGFDRLFIRHIGDTKVIFASRGGTVMQLTYDGLADIEAVISAAAEYLARL